MHLYTSNRKRKTPQYECENDLETCLSYGGGALMGKLFLIGSTQ